MARNSKSLEPSPVSSQALSLSSIDEQIANEVALLRQQIDAPTGAKLQIKPTGEIIGPDGTNYGNSVDMVVLDFMNRYNFFLQPFDKNTITPPDCYAIGRVINDMAPEQDSPAIQHTVCRSCPMNQYKSHRNGTAKACQNRYWAAVLLVNPDDPEAHNRPDAPIYILDLSPTNRKPFEQMLTSVTSAMGAPIKAIVTMTAKNVGTYAAISFTDPMPNTNYGVHYARRAEAEPMLTRKPDFTQREQAPANRGRGARPATARR